MKYQRVLVLATLLAILVGGCAKNQPPEIVAVKAYPEEISPGAKVDLVVTATDPEHGKLKFSWKAKDGMLGGNKDSTASWTAPDKPANYKVTVKVSDGKGGSAEKTVEVKVVRSGSVYSGSLQEQGGTERRQKTERQPRPRKSARTGKQK